MVKTLKFAVKLSLFFQIAFVSIGVVSAHAGNIIVMRHGQADHNINGLMNSRVTTTPSNLTLVGKKQVLRSARILRDWYSTRNSRITAVYASPLARTRQTADIVMRVLGLKNLDAQYDDRLIEVNWGPLLEGRPVSEFPGPNHWDHTDAKSYGGETDDEIRERVWNFLREVRAQAEKEGDVLVVTHGSPAIELLTILGLTGDSVNLHTAGFRFVDVTPMPELTPTIQVSVPSKKTDASQKQKVKSKKLPKGGFLKKLSSCFDSIMKKPVNKTKSDAERELTQPLIQSAAQTPIQPAKLVISLSVSDQENERIFRDLVDLGDPMGFHVTLAVLENLQPKNCAYYVDTLSKKLMSKITPLLDESGTLKFKGKNLAMVEDAPKRWPGAYVLQASEREPYDGLHLLIWASMLDEVGPDGNMFRFDHFTDPLAFVPHITLTNLVLMQDWIPLHASHSLRMKLLEFTQKETSVKLKNFLSANQSNDYSVQLSSLNLNCKGADHETIQGLTVPFKPELPTKTELVQH